MLPSSAYSREKHTKLDLSGAHGGDMRRSKIIESPIVGALNEVEVGASITEVILKHGISRATFIRGSPRTVELPSPSCSRFT